MEAISAHLNGVRSELAAWELAAWEKVTLLDPPFFAPDGEGKVLPGRVVQH